MGSNVMGPQWKVSYHIQQRQGPSKSRWLTFELLLNTFSGTQDLSPWDYISLCTNTTYHSYVITDICQTSKIFRFSFLSTARCGVYYSLNQ